MLHLQRATRTQSISHAATLFISLLVTTATVAHAATAVRELERSRLSSSPVAARQHGSLCAQWAVAVLTSPARCGSDLASFDSPSRRRKILGLIGLQCSPPSWMLQLDPSMADREGFIAIASSSGGWGKLTSAQLLCRGQGPSGVAVPVHVHAMRGSILPPICRQIITKSIRNNSVRDNKLHGGTVHTSVPPATDRSLRRDKWSHRSLLARCSDQRVVATPPDHCGSHPYPIKVIPVQTRLSPYSIF